MSKFFEELINTLGEKTRRPSERKHKVEYMFKKRRKGEQWRNYGGLWQSFEQRHKSQSSSYCHIGG